MRAEHKGFLSSSTQTHKGLVAVDAAEGRISPQVWQWSKLLSSRTTSVRLRADSPLGEAVVEMNVTTG